jgi:ABC-type transport system involved in cytochrome c biogenesis permease component
MRFLSVAERELRAAARHKATYRTRWITAAIFFALLVWLLWVFKGFSNRRAAPEVFEVFSVLTFIYCLITGTARTADCISSERREGTLGLLFLTNLNSAEIIAGKLCSSALASVYALFAIFPMLALPLLMGGITFEHFARTVLALLNGILFSLAAGFVASVVCVRQFTAIALAMGLAISMAGGLMIGAAAANSFRVTKPLADWLAVFSPLYTLISAGGTRLFVVNLYWYSLATVAGLSLAWLGLTTLWLARTWRDRPKSVRAWHRIKFWQRWDQPASASRVALRRRLLDINPFFWLSGRKHVSAPVFMCITVVLTAITVYVTGPLFGRVLRVGPNFSPVFGHLFAWLWTGLAIHTLALYYAAMAASQRLAEDKQSGALELILSTPATQRSISRGLWMAYGRRMFFPALIAVLVHFLFIWLCMTMATLDPPGKIPPRATPGEIFWSALLDRPLRGQVLDWEFGFLLRIGLLGLVLLMAIWLTLGSVGRWLGLRMKHPGFAPMTSLALVLAPPVLLFSFVCYLANEWHLDRLPDRKFMPAMMWVAFGIGVGHCLLLSVWAGTRLRRDFRTIVTSRFQPPSLQHWWRPTRRTVLRFAAGTAALAVTLALIGVSYYGYQNWRSERAWVAFQKGLKQKGESLDLAALLLGSVPENKNFARTPVFQSLVNRRNAESARLFDKLNRSANASTPLAGSPVTPEWIKQEFAPLDDYAEWTAPKSRSVTSTNLADYAPILLQALQTQRDIMADVTAAAHLPFLQTSTNCTARAVLHPNQNELLTLERLHFLFRMRACALLAMDRVPEASEDLLTSLRLARLARQLPDARSSIRVQFMIARSLQPLWEGLAELQWNDAQLAAFQQQLAEFNLLADHTNAIRRVVLAYIEIWQAIPDAESKHPWIPQPGDEYVRDAARQIQPRAWWFDNCIQLHRAGAHAMENIDVAGARVRAEFNWGDLNNLPLASEATQLFQQYYWSGPSPTLVAFAQNAVNQAIIACALERYHTANGKYPETLEQLGPAFLERIPNDIIRGRPMIYEPAFGRYVLCGVGPNGIDDRNKKGPVVTPPVSDDWLWSYGTNSPATK